MTPAAAHRGKRPAWIDPFSWAVAVCETGKGHGHPDWHHQSGSYGGAWGWYVGTWQGDRLRGMPLYPWNATPKQQYRVFEIGWFQKHHYWGCIANGGYRSWM